MDMLAFYIKVLETLLEESVEIFAIVEKRYYHLHRPLNAIKFNDLKIVILRVYMVTKMNIITHLLHPSSTKTITIKTNR